MTSIYLKVMELIHRDEDGQGLAEYALILALIAIIAIVALIFLGGQVSKILSTVGSFGLTGVQDENFGRRHHLVPAAFSYALLRVDVERQSY